MIRVRPWRALAAGVYLLAVIGLTMLPGQQVARVGLPAWLLDLGHIPLFAGLAFVTLSAFIGPARRIGLLTLGLCLAFALADEWLQRFVPGRVPAWNDVFADALGIAIGIFAGLGTTFGLMGAGTGEVGE